jgi:PGF-CTERM protein
MTVKNYDPDIMMGPANVSSWSVTDKSGSKKEVVVTLHPSVVQRNFNAPFSPSQWDSSKQSYKKSWEQADVGVDAFVGLQTAQMGQGGLSKLSGARLNTDAQAFTTPTTSNGRLVFNVAAPHCKVGAKTDPNDPAADDECNDKYVNNDGFYEAVIPKAFWKDQWGSGLNADNMSIVYKNDGTEETLTNIEVTKRQSGALYVEAKGIHYSSGDLETVEDTTDPTADAGSDTSVTVGTSVSFDGTSSSDSETSVTTYEWDVDGDGTYETSGSTPSHSYSSPGTYTVTLKVEDGGSNVETDTMTVTVSDTTGPTASVGSDTTVTVGTAVTFDGSTSTDNVGVTSYEWDVDGDGTTDATGAAPSHTFATAGTYDVTLTVKDAAGNTDTATRTVTVADKSVPTASVGADTTVDVGAAVTFDGSGSADNVAVTSYEWDVDGDGTVDATGATATHTYASAGTYTATLTVTDDAGNSDTATRTVTVEATDDDTTGPPVEVTARSGQTDVVVRAHSGDVSVDLAHAGSETGNVSADSVAFDTTEPEAFTLNVSTPASAAEAGVPDPEPSDVGTVVGYVQVDHTVSDADLSAVSIDVTVGWDALADGPSGGDIVVYRYHDGEWHPLDTEIDHYSDRGVHLTVDSPGLSVFAVGSERAGAFSVGEATVDATSVTAGESVTVAVPVTNDGTAVDETTLTVTADDRTLTVETVRLLPGQSTTVEIPATFDDPGEYELQVDDRVVDTVTVSAAATATATPSTTATPEPESTATPESTPTAEATPTPDDASPTAGSGPGFGFLVTVVAAVLTALAARWRR